MSDVVARFEESKDPEERLDYVIDASKELLASDDTINTYTVDIVTNTNVSPLVIASHSKDAGKITIWFTGGKADTIYLIHCHIDTAGGRELEQTVELLVAER